MHKVLSHSGEVRKMLNTEKSAFGGKKKILLPLLGLATLIVAGAFAVNTVKADEVTDFPPFIEKLVERFNLNESDVQTFFDEQRVEHHQAMLQNREERLNQAVSDGVITEAQKEALTNKWEEMQQERQLHREEMQKWFEEQGIDTEVLREYAGFGHGRFGHFHMGK